MSFSKIRFQHPFFLLLLSLFISTSLQLTAQERYKIVFPNVHFFAGTPFEDIDGTSDKLVGILDVAKNEFAFRIAMNSFQFPRALMQEHYNENYLETEKFPNADFKGSIEGDIDWETNGTYDVIAKGEFIVHGVAKFYEIPTSIRVQDGENKIKAIFEILLKDHEIKIPKIVILKIADSAEVTVEASLEAF